MCQVNCVIAPRLGSNGVLLREYETHDLAELDVIQEKLNVYRIRLVLRGPVWLIIDEVVG